MLKPIKRQHPKSSRDRPPVPIETLLWIYFMQQWNDRRFGIQTHIGTGTEGRVHSIVVTDASVRDSTVMDELIRGQEIVVYGD